jgi:hypothetical protein
MHIFRLQPTQDGVTDQAWRLSWHVGPSDIAANSAQQARVLAACRYTVAIHPGAHLKSRRSPWLDPRLVTVEEINRDQHQSLCEPAMLTT